MLYQHNLNWSTRKSIRSLIVSEENLRPFDTSDAMGITE